MEVRATVLSVLALTSMFLNWAVVLWEVRERDWAVTAVLAVSGVFMGWVAICVFGIAQRLRELSDMLQSLSWLDLTKDTPVEHAVIGEVTSLCNASGAIKDTLQLCLPYIPVMLVNELQHLQQPSTTYLRSRRKGVSMVETSTDFDDTDNIPTPKMHPSISIETADLPGMQPMVPESPATSPALDEDAPLTIEVETPQPEDPFVFPQQDSTHSRRASTPTLPTQRRVATSISVTSQRRKSCVPPPSLPDSPRGRKSIFSRRVSIDKTPTFGELAKRLERQLSEAGQKKRGSILCVEATIPDGNADEAIGCAIDFTKAVLDIIKRDAGLVISLSANRVIASWNTHKPCPRHALNACHAAIEINHALQKQFPLQYSIVVAGGSVVSGYIGTDWQRAPFILGDMVEQATSLHALCPTLGVRTLVTDSVQELVKQQMDLRPVDVVSFGTKDGASVVVFELMGALGAIPQSTGDLYATAFSLLVSGRAAEARELLERLLLENPTDDQGARLLKLSQSKVPCTPYVRGWLGWQNHEAGLLEGGGISHSPATTRRRQISLGLRRPQGKFLWSDDHTTDDHKLRLEITSKKFGAKNHRSPCPSSGGETPPTDSPLRKESFPMPPHANSPRASTDSYCSSSDSEDECVPPPEEFVDKHNSSWRRGKKKLGQGAYGEVWLGMGADGSLVAMKCVRLPQEMYSPVKFNPFRSKQNAIPAEIEQILNEVNVLSNLSHENIVSYVSSTVADNYLLVCMEYVSGGSLATIISQFGTLPSNSVKRYTKEILRGLWYLHSHDVIHRDLKPGNVLVQIDGQCKLADFGTCMKLSRAKEQVSGTPMFMAPESCRGDVCKASDIWSLGLTVRQMITDTLPYPDIKDTHTGGYRLMRLLASDNGTPELPSNLGALECNFLKRCLALQAAERPTASELLVDPFLM
eukprot:Sspe_Gene.60230::Locus_33178_Transcript_1_1_Confidence_1.000_Length_2991::g.60230::m.60230